MGHKILLMERRDRLLFRHGKYGGIITGFFLAC